MTLKITHKHGTTASTPPVAGDIDVGELAINAADAEIYTKDTAGAVQPFKSKFTYPGTGAVPRLIESKLQDKLNVKDFGAVGDGSTNDSDAIQAAFDAIKAQGGGTIEFDGDSTYLLYASQSTQWGDTGAYVGSSTIVNGNMCKIIFNSRVAPGGAVGAAPTAFRSVSTTTHAGVLTGTYAVGDLVYNVDDASDFYEGEEVQVRIIDNAYDDVEAKHYYSAVVIDITGNAITLNRGVPEAFNAAVQSRNNNRRIIGQGIDGLPKDVLFKNFRFERYEGGGARPTSEDDRVIELRNSKNQGIENITLYRSSVLIRAVEQAYIRDVRANYNRISGSGSKGFPISAVNCVDYVIDNVYVENFQQGAIQNESYCSGIVRNLTAVNNIYQTYGVKGDANNSNITMLFKVIQESKVKIENLQITGAKGSYSTSTSQDEAQLSVVSTVDGGAVDSFRHVSVLSTETPALYLRLGLVSGRFKDTSKGISSDLDSVEEHTSVITFDGTETGAQNYFEAVPENCLILGWSFHVENQSDMSVINTVALRYEDASGTLVTPSQYLFSPTVELQQYSIATANLQYGPNGILGKINYDYNTERRVVATFSGGSPDAGARLVVKTKYARIDGFIPTNLSAKSTEVIIAPSAKFTSSISIGGTAAANTIDEYEEGTWTPAFIFATPGSTSIIYSTSGVNRTFGRFVKIGNVVLITGQIVTTTFTFSGANGAARLTGLPYFPQNNTESYGLSLLSYGGITGSPGDVIHLRSRGSGFFIFKRSEFGSSTVGDLAVPYFTSGTNLNLKFSGFYMIN